MDILCYNDALDIIVLVHSTMFQTYDIISCDTSCAHSYIPLHYLRKKEQDQRKEKENKNKRKFN